MNNSISRPEHYTRGSVEPIDLIQSQKLDALQANVVKYVCRFPYKNGSQDLEKALQYLVWLYIQTLFEENGHCWTVNTLINGERLPDICLKLISEAKQLVNLTSQSSQ